MEWKGNGWKRLVKSQDFGVRLIPAFKASCLVFSVLLILEDTEKEGHESLT